MSKYIKDLYDQAGRELKEALDEFCPMDEENYVDIDNWAEYNIETPITPLSIPTPSGGIMEIQPQTIVIIPDPVIDPISDLDCPHFFYDGHIIDEDNGFCINCKYRDYTILSEYKHELMQVFSEFKLRKQWFVGVIRSRKIQQGEQEEIIDADIRGNNRYMSFIIPSENINEVSKIIDIPVKKYTYNEIAMTLDALPDWEVLK